MLVECWWCCHSLFSATQHVHTARYIRGNVNLFQVMHSTSLPVALLSVSEASTHRSQTWVSYNTAYIYCNCWPGCWLWYNSTALLEAPSQQNLWFDTRDMSQHSLRWLGLCILAFQSLILANLLTYLCCWHIYAIDVTVLTTHIAQQIMLAPKCWDICKTWSRPGPKPGCISCTSLYTGNTVGVVWLQFVHMIHAHIRQPPQNLVRQSACHMQPLRAWALRQGFVKD